MSDNEIESSMRGLDGCFRRRKAVAYSASSVFRPLSQFFRFSLKNPELKKSKGEKFGFSKPTLCISDVSV